LDVEIPNLKLLQVDLTDQCPLYCRHCSNSSGPLRNTHFPIERLIGIVEEAKGLGAERLVYSGGEPLRYPYLERAISAARSTGIHTTIFTTGIEDSASRMQVAPERWCVLRNQGLVAARFSIYAGPTNREFHNAIVVCKPLGGDAFGVNEQAIRDAGSAGVTIELHFIPCSVTTAELQDIYCWAADLGCASLHLQMPTYQGRNSEGASMSLTYEEELRLKTAALNLRGKTGATAFYISRFWRCRWDISPSSGCSAAIDQLIIRADGEVSPCNACKYGASLPHLDNVLAPNESLSRIWRASPALLEIRKARIRGAIPVRCEGVLAVSPKRTVCTA
jgi:MoaA/NifB/PqqE/SkfB family radical SAM enzyme